MKTMNTLVVLVLALMTLAGCQGSVDTTTPELPPDPAAEMDGGFQDFCVEDSFYWIQPVYTDTLNASSTDAQIKAFITECGVYVQVAEEYNTICKKDKPDYLLQTAEVGCNDVATQSNFLPRYCADIKKDGGTAFTEWVKNLKEPMYCGMSFTKAL